MCQLYRPAPYRSLDMSASKCENGDAHRLDPELAVSVELSGRAISWRQ